MKKAAYGSLRAARLAVMEISDYMLWKAAILIVGAFIAGLMGWFR